jgi:hypothetical protein
MKCWFWNIDAEKQGYFASELKAGRLRQEWGYQSHLDLIHILLLSLKL